MNYLAKNEATAPWCLEIHNNETGERKVYYYAYFEHAEAHYSLILGHPKITVYIHGCTAEQHKKKEQ